MKWKTKETCCSKDKCYFKKIVSDLDIEITNRKPGELLYAYYSPDDPNTPGYNPVIQQGLLLEPHTTDLYVSACVRSVDGQVLNGSAAPTNYFTSVYSTVNPNNPQVPERELSVEFKSHGCSKIDKVYMVLTDVDTAPFQEGYDIQNALANGWTIHPASGSFTLNGTFHEATANDQRLVLEYANGIPPITNITGRVVGGTGQSVMILLADYYVPVDFKCNCKGKKKFFDCDGEYTGEVFEASTIEMECCKDCKDTVPLLAPPSFLINTISKRKGCFTDPNNNTITIDGWIVEETLGYYPYSTILVGAYNEDQTQFYNADTVTITEVECPTEESCVCQDVTRGQLLTLRNTDALQPGCTYRIPYSRGCLVDAVLHIQAICSDTLSHDIHVQTTWDNELWEGRYSIDSNRILELHDNLGNKVGGRLGNEVDRFAWGITSVNNNNLFNSNVYMDCDTTQNISFNTWESNSYTDLRGFEGSFIANTITSNGRVYLNAATTVDFRRNQIQSYSYVYFNGGIDNIYIRQNTIADNSYVRKFVGTDANRFTLIDSLIARGDVRHYFGIAYINSVDVLSSGRLYLRNKGTNDIRYSTVSDLSFLDVQGQAGIFRFWYSKLQSLAYLYQRVAVSGGDCFIYYSNFASCTFDMRSGSNDYQIYYHKQHSNGYFRADDVIGTVRLYQNTLQSRGEIRLNKIESDLNIYYNNIQSYLSSLFLDSISGNTKTIYYNTFNSSGRLRIINHSGNLNIQHNSFDSYGQVQIQNSACEVRLFYSKFESIARVNIDDKASDRVIIQGCSVSNRAEIDINGGTGNTDIYYSTIRDYRAGLYLNATTRVYVYSANLNSNGRHIANGGQTDIRNSKISSSSLYTTTNGSATTRLWNTELHSLSRVNSTGSYIYASQVGSQTTLNAGAFQFLRSRVHGLGTRTLTANNNNRFEEIGTNGLI